MTIKTSYSSWDIRNDNIAIFTFSIGNFSLHNIILKYLYNFAKKIPINNRNNFLKILTFKS